ncbi:Uncharacterised protein [Bordetella pertussis]|nr:Uncharacterised protein [Bordetella pertussis]
MGLPSSFQRANTPSLTTATRYVPFCLSCRSKVLRILPRLTFSACAALPSGAMMSRPSRRSGAWLK